MVSMGILTGIEGDICYQHYSISGIVSNKPTVCRMKIHHVWNHYRTNTRQWFPQQTWPSLFKSPSGDKTRENHRIGVWKTRPFSKQTVLIWPAQPGFHLNYFVFSPAGSHRIMMGCSRVKNIGLLHAALLLSGCSSDRISLLMTHCSLRYYLTSCHLRHRLPFKQVGYVDWAGMQKLASVQ